MKKIFATIWLLALGCQIQPAAAWTVVNNICSNGYSCTGSAAHIEGGQCASCLKNDYAAGATASCPDGDNGCGRSNGYFISANIPGGDQPVGCPNGAISGDSQLQISGYPGSFMSSTLNGVAQGPSLISTSYTSNSGAVTGNPCNNYP